MSISFTNLGPADGDNALYVVVNTGQSHHALLFDCGEDCPSQLPRADLQAVEHLLFSHFHMDHISGFDSFFRSNFNREGGPVNVWGPEETITVMQHRFLGFSWNLHHDQPGEWHVHEILNDQVRAAKLVACEAFEMAHPLESAGRVPIISHPAYTVEARLLNHGNISSMGYIVRESARKNVDIEGLVGRGFSPGSWLKAVSSERVADSEVVVIGDSEHRIGDLREDFLVLTPGKSIAYLTDFCLSESDGAEVVEWLTGVDTLVCEAQYRHSDLELAIRNHHSTTLIVGELARDAKVGELILQHVSRRYSGEECLELLAEARSVFPNTRFPSHWDL